MSKTYTVEIQDKQLQTHFERWASLTKGVTTNECDLHECDLTMIKFWLYEYGYKSVNECGGNILQLWTNYGKCRNIVTINLDECTIHIYKDTSRDKHPTTDGKYGGERTIQFSNKWLRDLNTFETNYYKYIEPLLTISFNNANTSSKFF